MQVLGYAVFFGAFTWFVVTVQNRRRLLAVTLAGVMVVTLVGAPQPAQAQIGLLQAIQAVLNVINGVIHTALNGINTVRTAMNNLQHGLLAHTIVLEDENLQAFTDLLSAFERNLGPRNEMESDLVRNMAVCRWRLLRLWAIESSSLKIEMDKHDPAANSPSIRAALAFRTLADESHSLDLLNRYETRFDRQYARSLALLFKMRNEFCHSEPIPNSNT